MAVIGMYEQEAKLSLR